MKNNVILITGSTDGIGRQAALELAATGATIIVHGREHDRGRKTVTDIQTATGNHNVDLLIADLSSLHQVRLLADKLLRGKKPLEGMTPTRFRNWQTSSSPMNWPADLKEPV